MAPNPGMPVAPLRDAASGGELSRVLRAVDTPGGARRVAIVATSDFQFGMARMAATLLSSGGLTTEYQAFRDLGEARAWLGATPEHSGA